MLLVIIYDIFILVIQIYMYYYKYQLSVRWGLRGKAQSNRIVEPRARAALTPTNVNKQKKDM